MHEALENVKRVRRGPQPGRPRGRTQPLNFHMRVDAEFYTQLAKLSASWPDNPSDAEVVRRVVRAAAALEARVAPVTKPSQS